MAIDIGTQYTPVAWRLDTPDQMFEAASELADRGFRGEVRWCRETPDADDLAWTITLNAEQVPGIPEVRALLGEGLLLVAGVLRKLTDQEMEELP